MADAGGRPSTPPSRTAVYAVLGLLLVAGGAGWILTLDAGPDPFLPEQVPTERERLQAAFPNATNPAVHILLVAEGDGSVLTPDALTALAGLLRSLDTDDALAAALEEEQAVRSILEVLEDDLPGRPGQWSQAQIDQAIEAALEDPDRRRELTRLLSTQARLGQGPPAAPATAVVISLAPGQSAQAVEAAQDRIAELATGSTTPGIRAVVDTAETREQAALSLPGLWVPLVVLGLLLIAGLLVQPGPGRLAGWVATTLGSAGGGLLAATAIGAATPLALAAAFLGATVGVSLALATRERPVVAGLALLALGALVAWPGAGIGSVAAVILLAALVPQAVAWLRPSFLHPEAPPERASWREPGGVQPRSRAMVALALVLGTLGTLAVVGLPGEVVDGAERALPGTTAAGQATSALSTHFRGVGPGEPLSMVAWGSVTDPTFLGALSEAEARLTGSAASDQVTPARSVLTLARDWATDQRELDAEDRYDPAFAQRWRNATEGGPVPLRSAGELFDTLEELDPEGMDAVLERRASGHGAALLLLEQAGPGAGPAGTAQTAQAARASLDLVADEVAVAGVAIDVRAGDEAIEQARGTVLVASLGAALLPALAGLWPTRGLAPRVVVLAVTGLFAALVTMAVLSLLTVPLGPAGLLMPALAASIAAPGAMARLREVEGSLEDGAPPPLAVEEAALTRKVADLLAWAPAIVGVLALISSPAGGLRWLGGAFLVALVAAWIANKSVTGAVLRIWAEGTPGPVATGPVGAPGEGGLVAAKGTCPVCQRVTATGASRCQGCGRWNVVEGCPAHPEAGDPRCGHCGAGLDAPHFG